MGAQGEDIQLSPLARSLFPHTIECKNLARFVGYKYYEQAVSHKKQEGIIPIVVVKANRKEPLVIISLEDFLNASKNSCRK